MKNLHQRTRGRPNVSIEKTTGKEETVLFALHNKEIYGLQVPKAIEESSNGTRSISEGALYPILRSLEKKGFVSARWGEDTPDSRGGARRRYYKLTEEGIAKVEETRQFYSNLLSWQPS